MSKKWFCWFEGTGWIRFGKHYLCWRNFGPYFSEREGYDTVLLRVGKCRLVWR